MITFFIIAIVVLLIWNIRLSIIVRQLSKKINDQQSSIARLSRLMPYGVDFISWPAIQSTPSGMSYVSLNDGRWANDVLSLQQRILSALLGYLGVQFEEVTVPDRIVPAEMLNSCGTLTVDVKAHVEKEDLKRVVKKRSSK